MEYSHCWDQERLLWGELVACCVCLYTVGGDCVDNVYSLFAVAAKKSANNNDWWCRSATALRLDDLIKPGFYTE